MTDPEKSAAPGLPKLGRFDHLEIGDVPAPVSPPAAAPAAAAGADGPCRNCGRFNEKERKTCWACFKPFQPMPQAPAPVPADITLVLNGKTYRSADPELPDDVRDLFQKIQKEGYSEKVMAEWRSGRAASDTALPEPKPKEAEPIKVFKEDFRSIIRLDGTLYYSDDPDLPPELKELFSYLAANGVTPELMAHLRQYGNKVKLRPHTTARPSDGDLDFWNHVNSSASTAKTSEPVSVPLFLAALKILPLCLAMVGMSSFFQMAAGDYFRRREAQTAQADGTILETLGMATSRGGGYAGIMVRAAFTMKSGQEVPLRFTAGGNDKTAAAEQISPVVGTQFPVRYDPDDPKNWAVGNVGDPTAASYVYPIYYAALTLLAALILRVLWIDVRPLFFPD